jgi:hypothetical protein
MKGECFGNPKGSFLLPYILKVLPKEAVWHSLPTGQRKGTGAGLFNYLLP